MVVSMAAASVVALLEAVSPVAGGTSGAAFIVLGLASASDAALTIVVMPATVDAIWLPVG